MRKPWIILAVFVLLAPSLPAADAPARKRPRSDEVSGKVSFNPATFDPLQGKVYRANLGRTGVFQATGLPADPKVKWTFKTGGPVRSSPVVVDGIIYIGSNDGNVYAIDAGRGTLVWKRETGGMVSGSAAVAGGVVYIASEAGLLLALDAKTGREIWKVETGGASCGSPAVLYGTVFQCNGGRGGHEKLGMGSGKMLAVDAETGRIVWNVTAGPNGVAAIATDGRYLYIGTGYQDGANVGYFDIANGKVLHQVHSGSQGRLFTSHVVVGNRWYGPFSMKGLVRAFEDTKELWKVATLPSNSNVNVNAGYEFGYEIFADLAVTDRLMLTPCNDGKLHAYTTDKGEEAWAFETGGPIQSAPAVAGNLAYFGSWDGHLYAVGLDGKLRWKLPLGGKINSSPWPGDGVLYVGCDDGNVYAVQ